MNNAEDAEEFEERRFVGRSIALSIVGISSSFSASSALFIQP
jgi:hypothetical protein